MTLREILQPKQWSVSFNKIDTTKLQHILAPYVSLSTPITVRANNNTSAIDVFLDEIISKGPSIINLSLFPELEKYHSSTTFKQMKREFRSIFTFNVKKL